MQVIHFIQHLNLLQWYLIGCLIVLVCTRRIYKKYLEPNMSAITFSVEDGSGRKTHVYKYVNVAMVALAIAACLLSWLMLVLVAGIKIYFSIKRSK